MADSMNSGLTLPVAHAARPSALLHPLAYLRWRWRRWWSLRLRPVDSVTLTQRSVYIVPSRPGFMLGATLMLLLLSSINYQLNLGYLLTFLLAGSALVGMHVCHGTLRGLTLSVQPPQPQFAGSAVAIEVRLSNVDRRTRFGIGLRVRDGGHWSWADVPGQGSVVVQVAWKPERRGLHLVPVLTAETRFPLGTFRVWTVWQPASSALVYPKPELNPPPFPPGEPRAGGAASAAHVNTGEFDGVRAYRRGDPMKLVVWKKFAKADELVSRDTQQAQRYELWFDLSQAGAALDLEHRLSRLCAWVLRAEEEAMDYGLRLPSGDIQPGSGQLHRNRCLEALALC